LAKANLLIKDIHPAAFSCNVSSEEPTIPSNNYIKKKREKLQLLNIYYLKVMFVNIYSNYSIFMHNNTILWILGQLVQGL
jgi:hypothetical protein